MSAQQALSLLQDMSKLNGNGVLSSVVQVDANSSGTATIECPKSMVGRVIGKGGETIKALQQYTGAMIQIDQSQDPTRVTIVGDRRSVDTAASMVKDIVEGNFKGFAMLRQMTLNQTDKAMPGWDSGPKPQPMYVQGYGFVPPSQYDIPEDTKAATLAQTYGEAPMMQSHLTQVDPLSPLFQHGVSAAQLNALAANGHLLGNAQIQQNGSLAFSPSVGVKNFNMAAHGLNPLAVDAKSPATRRLFNGVSLGAEDCTAAGPAPLSTQEQRVPSPLSASMYRSAPTSPQGADFGVGQALGTSVFDFRSAPTSPSSAAFSFKTFPQGTTDLGSGSNSFSALELGSLAVGNGQGFGQLGQGFLPGSAGFDTVCPEDSAAALQAIHARLGLDSSLGGFNAGGNARQSLHGGPRSISMGALGQNRQAFFGGINGVPSFNKVQDNANGIASSATTVAQDHDMTQAMNQAMLGLGVSQNPLKTPQAAENSMIAASAAPPTIEEGIPDGQEVNKESPGSSFNSTSSTSLWTSGGGSPKLPQNWMKLADPEGRYFFLNMTNGKTQWDFPLIAA